MKRQNAYSSKEDALLCQVWLDTIIDPIYETDQKGIELLGEVHAWYQVHMHYMEPHSIHINYIKSSFQHRWAASKSPWTSICVDYAWVMNRDQSGIWVNSHVSFVSSMLIIFFLACFISFIKLCVIFATWDWWQLCSIILRIGRSCWFIVGWSWMKKPNRSIHFERGSERNIGSCMMVC